MVITTKEEQVREHKSKRKTEHLNGFILIFYLLQEFLIKLVGNNEAWIGLNDKNEEGTWKWVNGKRLTTA